MKKLILIFLTVFLSINSYSNYFNSMTPDNDPDAEKNQKVQQIPKNYQQLKFQALNYNDTKPAVPINNYRRGGDDYMMLYVAGGVVVLSSAFVLINGKSEYGDGLGAANTGIIIGGSVSAALITTKFFIDRAR